MQLIFSMILAVVITILVHLISKIVGSDPVMGLLTINLYFLIHNDFYKKK